MSRALVTTMVGLGPVRRALLAEALRELANPIAAALVLGQLVGEGRLSVSLLASGCALWLVLLGAAVLVAPEKADG